MTETGSITVLFCCNDDRGNDTGRVRAIDFADRRGYRASLTGPSIRFGDASLSKFVKVGRRHFPVERQSTPWVGNMFWNAVQMSKAAALRLLMYVLERGYRAEEWTEDGPFAAIVKAPAWSASGCPARRR